MLEVDRLLEDVDLLNSVFEAQGKRHAQSSRLGRQSDFVRGCASCRQSRRVQLTIFSPLTPEVKKFLPEAIVTYCLPPAPKVIGEAFKLRPT